MPAPPHVRTLQPSRPRVHATSGRDAGYNGVYRNPAWSVYGDLGTEAKRNRSEHSKPDRCPPTAARHPAVGVMDPKVRTTGVRLDDGREGQSLRGGLGRGSLPGRRREMYWSWRRVHPIRGFG